MIHQLIEKLMKKRGLTKEEYKTLLSDLTTDSRTYLYQQARETAMSYFGNQIYTRGLIEFSNYCKNDCFYCGIRKSNLNLERYRLTKEEILSCCDNGYMLGFRTFVLQGGEDPWFHDDRMEDVVLAIRQAYPDCAITLSLGERSYASYLRLFKAGANRYLLRHETADSNHYGKLHPKELTLQKRKQCLYDLKQIGYQVGTGFMVGSPYQTLDHLAEDLLFLEELKPMMIGIGPFLSHKDTPFAPKENGTLGQTLDLIAIIRLMFPNALIPSTTALGTIDKEGREFGILAGANVVMPNLSPVSMRKNYALYDNKICTGEEAAECRLCLDARMKQIGYEIVTKRGDYVPMEAKQFDTEDEKNV